MLLALALLAILASYASIPIHTDSRNAPPLANLGCVRYAKITIVIDNHCNPFKHDLECPWGLSVYIKLPNAAILFDTGPSPSALQHNARELGIDLANVNYVVISHEHFDHVGGLPAIAKVNPLARIYVPKGMDPSVVSWIESLDKNVVVVPRSQAIAKGVAVIGPLYGPPSEEALLINVCNFGPVLIVGCSHPGIDNFVKLAEKLIGKNISLIIGGFHLIGYPHSYIEKLVKELVKDLGVSFIAPIHCSGSYIRKYMSKHYPNHYIELYVGSQLYIDP